MVRTRATPLPVKGKTPNKPESNRNRAMVAAVLGVVALVVVAIVFTGASTSGRVAQNAKSLHWANAMLGSSEITRLALSQAIHVAQDGAADGEQADAAAAAFDEAKYSLDVARYWAARSEAEPVAVAGVTPLLNSADEVLAALEAGDVDGAITMLESDFESTRAQAVAALTKAQDDATDRIEQTEAAAGSVATILQFIVVLFVPAMALFFYRRRVNAQLREETIRMDARLETHRAVAQAKDHLIAAVSHELRTPLTSIAGFAEILADDQTMSPAQHDMVEVINAESAELARMVEDFLVAARFDHEVMDLETTDVEIMGTIAPLIESAEAAGREVEVDPRLLWVKGDRDRIVHIVRNLVSNAIAHGGPKIRIVVLREEGAGRLVIADNGPGIAAESHDALFEPFINEGSRALVTGSLGMGLAVARELAREMDGELTLERTVDGWTCFSLSLPAGVASEEATTPEQLVA